MGYNSPRRQEAAAITRQAILDAACQLFISRGYAATTVGDIAQAARVAPGTVYTSVGGKPKVLEAIAQQGADDPHLGELIDAISRTKDPHEAIRRAAAGTRYSAETNADIFEIILLNAPFDEVVATVNRDAEQGFRHGARKLATHLRELKALRGTVNEAIDTIAYFLGHASWRRVITDFGWTYDKAESWLTLRLTEALLKS
jgi:AcrR family transcriptional regulator